MKTEENNLNPVKLVKEILDNQEILSKHKNNEECKLKENWSYSLGSQDVITKVVEVSTRLSNVIENKENILETLRNPIADNSIPWTKERQSDLVESFNYLVSNSLTIDCIMVASIYSNSNMSSLLRYSKTIV